MLRDQNTDEAMCHVKACGSSSLNSRKQRLSLLKLHLQIVFAVDVVVGSFIIYF